MKVIQLHVLYIIHVFRHAAKANASSVWFVLGVCLSITIAKIASSEPMIVAKYYQWLLIDLIVLLINKWKMYVLVQDWSLYTREDCMLLCATLYNGESFLCGKKSEREYNPIGVEMTGSRICATMAKSHIVIS